MGEQIKKSTPAGIKEIKQEVKDWESELKRLQALAVVAAERDKLKSNQLPLLERQVEEKEAELPVASKKAEEVSLLYLLHWARRLDTSSGTGAVKHRQKRAQGNRRTEASRYRGL